MERGRWVGFVVVALALAGLAALGYAAGHGAQGSRSGEAPAPERAAGYRFCKVWVAPLPAGLALRDRQLRNLGGNVMGESVTYTGGGRKLQVHIGYDALGAADDLDFAERGTTYNKGRAFTLLQSAGLPSIRAAYADEAGPQPPCNALTVFTTRFSPAELVAVLGAVRVAAA
jgi:hypothetical protein